MPTYEIINPSDPYTFHAEDDKVAGFVATLLGEGNYECEREDGESLDVFMLLMSKEQTTAKLLELFPEGVNEFKVQHKEEIIKALESIMSFNKEERRAYDEAIKIMEPKKVEEYRAKIHNDNRSSLNDIGNHAWNLAKSMRG